MFSNDSGKGSTEIGTFMSEMTPRLKMYFYSQKIISLFGIVINSSVCGSVFISSPG